MTKIFYQELKEDKNYQKRLSEFDTDKIQIITFINKNLAFNLRHYQEKALYVFQYFMGLPKEDYFKSQIIENFNDHEIPFYSFEMATGSGKTLLMAAKILNLYKKGIRDFLIITPNTPIYQKTINNFTLDDRRCVFSPETGLKFSLVTGDSYKDKTSHYNDEDDIHVYVFNIQKFFERISDKQDESKGQAYTHRPLEESYWKDEHNNTISFVDFLRKKKLAIITDEAHHYQNKKSEEVIKELLPEMVLEYTATALEDVKDKKKQKIIYKYSIKEFIGQKYGKKIRALGYAGLVERSTNQVTDADKKKIILSLLCHLVKKQVLKGTKQKPIILLRSRQVEHSVNLLDYIHNELIEDEQNINEVLETSKHEKAPITKLFWEWFSKIKFDKEKLINEFNKICKNSFRIDSENKNDTEIIEQWDTIEDNKYEIVVYVRMLDEGIDINNIYLLTVLSDSDSSIKTNVKQAIGRGVRLYKEQREFDEVPDNMKKQSENLYLICDKNRNFEKFIEDMRTEMGLSKEEFSHDVEETEKEDKPEIDKIKHLDISVMKLRYVDKEGIDTISILDKAESKISKFLACFCFDENGKNIIDLELESALDERDIVSSEYQQTLSEHLPEERILELSAYDIEVMSGNFIEETGPLPDTEIIKDKISSLIKNILDKKLYYKTTLGFDHSIIKNLFYKQFESYFSHYIESNLLEIELNVGKKKLSDIFKSRMIVLEENSYRNFEEYDSQELTIPEIKVYFKGFKHSIYEYNKFDSPQERKIAVILDKIIDKEGDKNDFWIKNGRRIEYNIKGRHDYNPDFIVYLKGQFYIIEVKGSGIYLNEFINKGHKDSFEKLEEESSDVKTVLLLSTIIDSRIVGKVNSFKSLLSFNSLKGHKLLSEFSEDGEDRVAFRYTESDSREMAITDKKKEYKG